MNHKLNKKLINKTKLKKKAKLQKQINEKNETHLSSKKPIKTSY